MNPFAIQKLSESIGARFIGEEPEWPLMVTGVSSDSRQLQPGHLFVALRGDNFDGHNFLAQAAASGAVAALVDHEPAVRPAELVLLRVSDTRAAMGRLARCVRQQFTGTVIAVGGSNGKTGTKHLIDSALCQTLRGTFSPKSFNNDIGVPLAIFPADPAQDYLVLELGTNHPGEIANLTEIASPDVAVITNCAAEHLEGLGDLDGVRREEASLVTCLDPHGLLVVNGDDPELLAELDGRYAGRRVTFGLGTGCDLYATGIRCGFDGVEFRLNGSQKVFVPLMGRHTAVNALAAIAVARHMGLPDAQIIDALSRAHGPEMRLEVLCLERMKVINDAYNANPASMRAALETLMALQHSGRRVAVLGDMRELGEWTDSLHRGIGQFIAQDPPDLLVCVGEKAALIAQEARRCGMKPGQIMRFAGTDAAIDAVPDMVQPDDLVLLKASRFMKLEGIARALEAQPARKTA